MNQLRCKTEFSFGETFAPIKRIVERLTAINAKAAGIADEGTWGHVQWNEACRKASIIPLFGVQLGVAENLEIKEHRLMWFLALSSVGLQELYRYSSLAERQAVRGHARLTYANIKNMSESIAKFAGAITDERFLKNINAYIDLEPSSNLLLKQKLTLVKERDLRPVLTSDNYYSFPEDRATFSLIGNMQKPTPQHLMTEAEMMSAMKGISPAIRTAAIVAMDEIIAKAKEVKLPYAPLIKVEGHLEDLCRAGIVARKMNWTPDYEKRLQHELKLIREKDFESYFLMVAEMVMWAKTKMLVGPSRGSAAGSIVCYLTRITEVDPIKNKLIFERFIDVTRKDLPDIDLDFVDVKRDTIIEWLCKKYGEKNVANIGTISTYQPRSALIAVSKKLGVPPWETAAVKDALFERSSGDSRANFALLDTLEQTEPGRNLLAKFPAIKHAAKIEAHASHCGVHASGILVCNDAIENYCTVTAAGIAQLDKKDAEKLNLLKIDVLGLRTLGVLEDSGVKVDWYNLKLDDPAVWNLLNKKRYAGIFQFEGLALQSIASQMTIGNLEDLGHITALARPGPMASGGATAYLLRRAGKQSYALPHPALAPYVKDTFGVVIYQEQVLQICRELGNMDWPTVTLLRKAMSKSLGKEYFDQFRDKFIAGAKENDIDKEPAIAIWEMVDTMGSWAFNLSHSYSYAVVSYWTAWLKAYHLLEFAAATLRNQLSDLSAIKLLRELKKEGIDYVPFDPDLSEINWSVKDGKLIAGFLSLKGIGPTKAAKLIAEREAASGVLPQPHRGEAMAMEKVFGDLFPTESRWGEIYRTPEKFGIREGTKVVRIEEIAGEAEFVYIGKLIGKDLRDQNEAIRMARRGGKRKTGPTLFLDLDIEDDTGKILTRIDRYDFEEIGRTIWEAAPIGSWWLIRGERKLWGQPDGGFKMIYVKRIKQLDKGETA